MSEPSVFEISNDLVLQELKSAYEREWRRKESVENKANNVITISGAVATLLFGFSAFIFTSLSHHSGIFDVVMSALVGSISASIIAILLSIIASGMQNYSYIMSKPDSNILKQYKDSTKYIVINTMIDDYHYANQKNSRENNKKANKVKYAQWVLFASILAVIVPLILLFFS